MKSKDLELRTDDERLSVIQHGDYYLFEMDSKSLEYYRQTPYKIFLKSHESGRTIEFIRREVNPISETGSFIVYYTNASTFWEFRLLV
jgi:hypothetical protein